TGRVKEEWSYKPARAQYEWRGGTPPLRQTEPLQIPQGKFHPTACRRQTCRSDVTASSVVVGRE
ncbi:MAG: hypothetical protein IJW33_04195, partial [Lentisphaeria bacterium]|nr:hypothetical protein [Lentisphaeria bacterium]